MNTIPLRVASPDQSRAEALLIGDEAAAAQARLRALRNHKDATQTIVDDLEAEQKRRIAPHEKRKAELRAAIELLETLEGEADDAISAIENEMRDQINAAEEDAAAADDAHWEAYRASKK